MGASLRLALGSFREELIPIGSSSKCFEILVSASHQSPVRGPHHALEINERFFIDLILGEEILVIAKVPQEPVQSPERAFRVVEPAGERAILKCVRFENNKTDTKIRFLHVPAVGGPFHADEK